jgi:Protein of unknown function (DUF3237)
MKLESLCEMELAYRDSSFGKKFVVARPYGGEEGSGYGEGDGKITGEKIKGELRWVNHPHRRSDGLMMPNAQGLIKTDDGALIHFSLQGRTVKIGDQGRQLLSAIFESADDRYKWLNNTFCVVEGKIDMEKLIMSFRVFSCVSDLL